MAGMDELGTSERTLLQMLEAWGLDGLLDKVVLTCQAAARMAEQAKQYEEAKRWKARAYHCRAYKTMARRVEGRADA